MSLIDRFFLKKPRVRRVVTKLLEGDRISDVELIGEKIRVHSLEEHGYLRSSRLIRSSALLRDELPVIMNLAGIICRGDTFVDVGANVGVYCLSLSRLRRVHEDLVIYAYEANPSTFERLQPHADRLGVHCFNIALSDHEGVLKFISGAVSHVFTTLENSSVYSLSRCPVEVPCMRLDQAGIMGESIILKIDVEGQEKQVLEGAQSLFSSGRIKAVYVDGYSDTEVESLLLKNGFDLLDGVSLRPKDSSCKRLLAVRI
jgi:FkbM family methyltransferase